MTYASLGAALTQRPGGGGAAVSHAGPWPGPSAVAYVWQPPQLSGGKPGGWRGLQVKVLVVKCPLILSWQPEGLRAIIDALRQLAYTRDIWQQVGAAWALRRREVGGSDGGQAGGGRRQQR